MKKEIKNIDFIVSVDIYPFDIWFFFGDVEISFEKLKEYLTKKELKKFKNFVSEQDGNGGGFYHTESKKSVIQLYNIPKNNLDICILNHEILHATFKILDNVGIYYSYSSEEAFTYLFDYLCNKVYEKLNLKFIIDDNTN